VGETFRQRHAGGLLAGIDLDRPSEVRGCVSGRGHETHVEVLVA